MKIETLHSFAFRPTRSDERLGGCFLVWKGGASGDIDYLNVDDIMKAFGMAKGAGDMGPAGAGKVLVHWLEVLVNAPGAKKNLQDGKEKLIEHLGTPTPDNTTQGPDKQMKFIRYGDSSTIISSN